MILQEQKVAKLQRRVDPVVAPDFSLLNGHVSVGNVEFFWTKRASVT